MQKDLPFRRMIRRIFLNDFSDAAAEVTETIAWSIADVAGEATGLSAPIAILHLLRDIHGELGDFDDNAPPNPLFLSHGFTGARSPRTSQYMASRSVKNMGSTVLGTAGSLGSSVTQVDAAGILLHSNATGSTLAHMKMLHDIAKRYPHSQTIQSWVRTCLVAKTMKAGIRGTELAGAAIPVGAVGIATTIGAAIARAGVRLKYGTVVSRVAMELHWRANVEMRLSGIGGGAQSQKANGPASAVFFEIFRRRSLTRFFGQYDVPSMIAEPGGWWALREKLLLM